jgi:uncharacterized membrane protein YfcA
MLDLPFHLLLLIAVSALLTATVHGATGLAGGVLMAAILSHILGIKVAIPVMTCALLFSHTSRVLMYWRDIDWSTVARVLLFGLPTIVLGAFVFTKLSPRVIALIFALFLIASFPIKVWGQTRALKTSPKLLAGASAIWGMLAGNVIGPGFFLAPFLLGTGMNRLTFVGTLAVIVLVMNATKLAVFSATDLMNAELLMLGVTIGLVTIPGNLLGRTILKRMQDSDHHLAVDIMTVMMIVNFLYLAISG